MIDLRELSGYINSHTETMSIGVVGVIMKDNKILLVRNSKTDYWSFPGGHLHEDESLLAGVKREVFEETGKQVTTKSEPIFYQYKLPSGLNLLLLFYLCEIQNDDGVYASENNEVQEIEWFEISQMPEKIYENTKTIIQHFTNKK
jgi:ADP-ribose pyrophosphatase YjhB (NUDIX family)